MLILESEAGTLLLYCVSKREEGGYYQQLKIMGTGVFEQGCCVSGEGGWGTSQGAATPGLLSCIEGWARLRRVVVRKQELSE